jgi:hypothetical protein
MGSAVQAAFRAPVGLDTDPVPRPKGLRPADEVIPKLGLPAGQPAVRIGDVAAYDRPIEHLAGQLDRCELDLPLRYRAARFGLVLCFALEPVGANALAAELVRIAGSEGVIWIAVWKKANWGEVASDLLHCDLQNISGSRS